MTCLFCNYQFCWSCGASATSEERHFSAGRGCGVKMTDENVKLGDNLLIQEDKKCCAPACFGRYGPMIRTGLIWVLMFLFCPKICLFYVPYLIIGDTLRGDSHICCKIIATPGLIILSALLIPVTIVMFYLHCILTVVKGIIYCMCSSAVACSSIAESSRRKIMLSAIGTKRDRQSRSECNKLADTDSLMKYKN